MIGAADIVRDLRHGARALRRSPGFTALVVVTLALGIGAVTAIFTLVDALLLRPLPVRDPDRLVLFSDGVRPGRYVGLPVRNDRLQLFSYPLYRQLQAAQPDVELVAQDTNAELSIVRRSGVPGDDPDQRADGRCVTANFFGVLGIVPQQGRLFRPDDETSPGANAVVVLSDAYWRRRFGADPALVGAHLDINGAPYLVVGVAPPGFTGVETGTATDFWVPVTMVETFTRFSLPMRRPDYWWLVVVGRLGPGAAPAVVEARANGALRAFFDANPVVADGPTRARTHLSIESARLGLSPVRRDYREPLLVLMAAVGLLMVIVCLNIGHLLLARAVKRQPEMSVRAALGASRARLLWQLIAEGVWLAVAGAAGGWLLTAWLKDLLLALVAARSEQPLVLDVRADGRVASVVGVLLVGTALLLGLVPALYAFRQDLQRAIRVQAPALTGGQRRLGRTLLASQVAFSLVLLVGAGLLVQTLARLRLIPSGFDDQHVLTAQLNTRKKPMDHAAALRLYDELQRRIGAVPGVRAVGLADSDAVGGGPALWAVIVPDRGRQSQMAQFVLTTPRTFAALGMQVLSGRGLDDGDRAGALPVAVVNQTMADELFGGDPLGRRLLLGSDGAHEVQVVGVVADTHSRGLRRGAGPIYYLPIAQAERYFPVDVRLASLAVRASGDPAQLAADVRRAVRDVDPGLPMLNVRTLRAEIDRSLGGERLLATLAGAFGVVALFLVAVGLYGVISQWAAQRARELGLRMALGATAGGVRWLVLRQALGLIAAGVLVGVPAALAASRWLAGVLYGVPPMHPPTLIAAALALFLVGLLAAYLPARRASSLDPMTALRCE